MIVAEIIESLGDENICVNTIIMLGNADLKISYHDIMEINLKIHNGPQLLVEDILKLLLNDAIGSTEISMDNDENSELNIHSQDEEVIILI